MLFKLSVKDALILLIYLTKSSMTGRATKTCGKKELIGNLQVNKQELNSLDFNPNPFFPFNGFVTVLDFTWHYGFV